MDCFYLNNFLRNPLAIYPNPRLAIYHGNFAFKISIVRGIANKYGKSRKSLNWFLILSMPFYKADAVYNFQCF